MSRLSDEGVSALAQRVLRVLRQQGLGITQERLALNETKRVLGEYLQCYDRIDGAVRRKIASLSRPIVPGSREWEVLYRKYFEEELRRLKLSS